MELRGKTHGSLACRKLCVHTSEVHVCGGGNSEKKFFWLFKVVSDLSIYNLKYNLTTCVIYLGKR